MEEVGMKWLFAIAFLFFLSCGMKNEDIVKQCNYCKKEGFESRIVRNGDGYIMRVECLPKKTNEGNRKDVEK